jgi:hypothetical protein
VRIGRCRPWLGNAELKQSSQYNGLISEQIKAAGKNAVLKRHEKRQQNGNKIDVDQHLFIFILSLVTPFVLYFNRHLDDNRLTSWNWVFGFVDLPRIGLMLGMALVLAWLLSSVSFYEKNKPLLLFVCCFLSLPMSWLHPFGLRRR